MTHQERLPTALDILLCHDLYFLTMVEGENEDKEAHPASKAEKQIPIFPLEEIDVQEEIDVLREKLTELGFALVELEFEEAEAARDKYIQQDKLSYQYFLCLQVSKRRDFRLVTNDNSLRKICSLERVHTIWGLELLALLFENSGISESEAIKLAEKNKSN